MIELIKYNKNTVDHVDFLYNLQNDKNVIHRLSSIFNPNNMTYIVANEKNYIGILKINREKKDCYSIDLGISSKYTNHGYGTLVLNKVIELFDNKYKIIYLKTSINNKSAIKCAIKAGFDYNENILDGNIILFYLKNPNYKKNGFNLKKT